MIQATVESAYSLSQQYCHFISRRSNHPSSHSYGRSNHPSSHSYGRSNHPSSHSYGRSNHPSSHSYGRSNHLSSHSYGRSNHLSSHSINHSYAKTSVYYFSFFQAQLEFGTNCLTAVIATPLLYSNIILLLIIYCSYHYFILCIFITIIKMSSLSIYALSLSLHQTLVIQIIQISLLLQYYQQCSTACKQQHKHTNTPFQRSVYLKINRVPN